MFIINLPVKLFNYVRIFFLKKLTNYNKFYTGEITEAFNFYGEEHYVIKTNNNESFLYLLKEAIEFETPSCFRKMYVGEKVRFKKGFSKKVNGEKYNLAAYIEPLSSIKKLSGYMINAKTVEDKNLIVSILVRENNKDVVIEKKLEDVKKSSRIQFGSYCEIKKKDNTDEILDVIIYGLVDIKKTTKSRSSNINRNQIKSPFQKIKKHSIYRILGFFNRIYSVFFRKQKPVLVNVKNIYENGDILFVSDDGNEYIYNDAITLFSSVPYINYVVYPNARVKIFKTSPFTINNKKIVLHYSMVANDNDTLKDIFLNNNYINHSFFEEHGKVKNINNKVITVGFKNDMKSFSYDIPIELVETDKKEIKLEDECFVVINKVNNKPIYCSVLEQNKVDLPDLKKFMKTNTNINIQ